LPLLLRGHRTVAFQALGNHGGPISGQNFGNVGFVSAFALLDLLGAPLCRGFAIFGSNGIRVDQLLGEARLEAEQLDSK